MKISEVTGDRIDNVTKLNIIKEEEKIIEEELQELKKVEEELDKAEELRKSADDLADRAVDLTADTMAQPPASDVAKELHVEQVPPAAAPATSTAAATPAVGDEEKKGKLKRKRLLHT